MGTWWLSYIGDSWWRLDWCWIGLFTRQHRKHYRRTKGKEPGKPWFCMYFIYLRPVGLTHVLCSRVCLSLMYFSHFLLESCSMFILSLLCTLASEPSLFCINETLSCGFTNQFPLSFSLPVICICCYFPLHPKFRRERNIGIRETKHDVLTVLYLPA